jgi:hypothetical protein
MNIPVFVFDVDMTLTKEFWTDAHVTDLRANMPVLNLALSMQQNGMDVVVVTARPYLLFDDTEFWLNEKGLYPQLLLMRELDDERPDYEVREDQIATVIEEYGDRVMLFDDNPENCRAVRAMGVPCIQVKIRE